MADYSSRVVSSMRYEWTLRTPAPVGELWKALAAAESRAKDLGVNVNYDDWLTIDHGDDEVILSFTVEQIDRPSGPTYGTGSVLTKPDPNVRAWNEVQPSDVAASFPAPTSTESAVSGSAGVEGP